MPQQKVTIELENMKFYAYHGHYEIEQKVGNHFLVNLLVEADATAASQSDRLKDALDYQQLYRLVKEEMEIPSHLLENVAGRIADRIGSEFETVTRMKVKISKMNPPMGGEMLQVSVTLER
jgi:7,8-dihydroneopterin aldolase/epimerase/oxygenase